MLEARSKDRKEIDLYCSSKGQATFSSEDFKDLSSQIGILPMGLTNTEKQVLEVLKQVGSATLTGLSARLGLSKTCLQRDHELYLLNKNLIEIDGQRKITMQGRQIYNSIIQI